MPDVLSPFLSGHPRGAVRTARKAIDDKHVLSPFLSGHPGARRSCSTSTPTGKPSF